MTAPRFFARPAPYLAWLAVSALGLTAAWATDPYVFGFTAYATAGLSGVLALVGLFHGLRPLLWSLSGFVPTLVAFAILSTYRWA